MSLNEDSSNYPQILKYFVNIQVYLPAMLRLLYLSAALLGDCEDSGFVGLEAAESRTRGVLLGRPLFLRWRAGAVPESAVFEQDGEAKPSDLTPSKLSLCIRATCTRVTPYDTIRNVLLAILVAVTTCNCAKQTLQPFLSYVWLWPWNACNKLSWLPFRDSKDCHFKSTWHQGFLYSPIRYFREKPSTKLCLAMPSNIVQGCN